MRLTVVETLRGSGWRMPVGAPLSSAAWRRAPVVRAPGVDVGIPARTGEIHSCAMIAWSDWLVPRR